MRCEIVAEIGINHDGNLPLALQMIQEAKRCGADVVKFQASYPRLETSARHAPEHLAMIEKYILTHADLEICVVRCREIGIEFLCTPAEEQSLAWQAQLIADGYAKRIKIASDNLTNRSFIEAAGAIDAPIIMSTGMGSIEMIFDAWSWLHRYRKNTDITLLHCVSAYPCAIEDANVSAILLLQRAFPRAKIGWSDHTTTNYLAPMAVAYGATMIEKHFTMGGTGPDHVASIGSVHFREMVRYVRSAELAIGSGARNQIENCELETARIARKSIVASRPIHKGQIFDLANLACRRPGTGMQCDLIGLLKGRVSSREYAEGEMIARDEIE